MRKGQITNQSIILYIDLWKHNTFIENLKPDKKSEAMTHLPNALLEEVFNIALL